MKKLFLGLMMTLMCLTAQAQFEKGKNYIGASVSGLGMSYSPQSKFTFGLNATAGRLLADNWMLKGTIGYDHMYHYDLFEIGVGGRFYIIQNGLYLGLDAAYGHCNDDGYKTNNFYLSPEVGYAFFINEYLTIEPAVYYRMSLNNFSDGSAVGLKIGLGYYF